MSPVPGLFCVNIWLIIIIIIIIIIYGLDV